MDPALGPQRLKPSRAPSRRRHSVLSPAREGNDSRFPEGVIQRSAGAGSANKTFYGSMLFKKRGWGISLRPRRTRSRYTTCAWRVGVLLPLIAGPLSREVLATCCWPHAGRMLLARFSTGELAPRGVSLPVVPTHSPVDIYGFKFE